MNVLILGAQGMAGHLAAEYWLRSTEGRIVAAVRPGRKPGNRLPADPRVIVETLDLRDFRQVESVVERHKPDVILNMAGVLKRFADERPLEAYLINGLLPRWLVSLGDRHGSRLIHVSTDCVFSGDRGLYREDDKPDGRTVYARTKALGEVRRAGHLTIRASIIGPDDNPNGIGLMKWFLSCKGEVAGYVHVPWNGITTLELAKAAVWFASRPEIGGLVHLASPSAVSKHDLLLLMSRLFRKDDVTVVRAQTPVLDRTLAVTRSDVDYRVPDHAAMLAELRDWMGRA